MQAKITLYGRVLVSVDFTYPLKNYNPILSPSTKPLLITNPHVLQVGRGLFLLRWVRTLSHREILTRNLMGSRKEATRGSELLPALWKAL